MERVVPARISVSLSLPATKILNATLADAPGTNISDWVSAAVVEKYLDTDSALRQEFNEKIKRLNEIAIAVYPGKEVLLVDEKV